MKLSQLIESIENIAPLALQESYDNSGLLIGDRLMEVHKALVCVDVTEAIIDEAIKRKFDLILSHHPFIFEPLKHIGIENANERIIRKAIKNDIAIYAAHTSLDNASDGLNGLLCKKLGLVDLEILSPKKNYLKKLIVFCPHSHANRVREALFSAGAGHIGNYDNCSFNIHGKGTFKALANANPFVGKKLKLHEEDEIRVETVFPAHLENPIISALLSAHPYEEVAYDIYALSNENSNVGSGMIGNLKKEVKAESFIKEIKRIFHLNYVRHSVLGSKKIRKVAICGGAGGFLTKEAIIAGADMFITAECKYHEFINACGRIVLVDVGHYESEQFSRDWIIGVLKKNFPKFVCEIAQQDINAVKYL